MKFITNILFIFVFIMCSQNISAQSNWIAPKSAEAFVNPIKNDQNSLKKGKLLFKQLCAVCHGDKGKGDGLASAALNPKPANFTSSQFKKQSDGAIFWKITEGRTPMASYKESLTTEQRWQLVNYIKSLKN